MNGQLVLSAGEWSTGTVSWWMVNWYCQLVNGQLVLSAG